MSIRAGSEAVVAIMSAATVGCLARGPVRAVPRSLWPALALFLVLSLFGAMPAGGAPMALPLPAEADTIDAVRPVRDGEYNSVLIRTEEPGRAVWIGRRFAGRTPLRVDSLHAGEIDLLIGDVAGSVVWYRPWKIVLTLAGDHLDTLRVGSLQRLQIRSDPAGERVQLGEEDLGPTPLWMLVPAGRTLAFRIRHWDGEWSSLEYQGGRVDSTLVLKADAPPVPKAELVPPASGFESHARVLLPLAAVAAGAAGLFARGTADDAYTSYQTTVDSGRMGHDLERAHTYDRLSGGCWIGAEVLLAAAAWTWLRAVDAPLTLEKTPSGEGAGIGIDLTALRSSGESKDAPERPGGK
jgi:hypothetical protein